jgi:ABC-type branched-subunit amino acid transport system ATPase component/ABC-type branched-subunit amino acid transport system permease subunit
VIVRGEQLLALIIVPIVTLFLWWLLGHTRFGESVRASATNPDLARLTGISPKLMSTAIWTIAGFLSALAIILFATEQGSSDLVSVGPETLLLGMTAALIGRMTSFPIAVLGAIGIEILRAVLTFNFPNSFGIDKVVLFVIVLVLVARMSRSAETGGESFSFAPRVPPIPERLREIVWVRRMPHMIGAVALVVAIVLPLIFSESADHQTYASIAAFAICAISVTVLTGWAGQLSLGQMAFAGIGALTAAALVRGATLDIGWRSNRLIAGSLRPVPFWLGVVCFIVAATAIGFALQRDQPSRHRAIALGVTLASVLVGGALIPLGVDRSGTQHSMPFVAAVLVGAAIACVVAVAIGLGALRVKGLLLAISTMAFSVAASKYLFFRPFFVEFEGSLNVELERGPVGPIDLTHRNRAFYYFVLAVLVVMMIVVGHLRRTGVGRAIIGVRENEQAAAALTVSPTRSKLTAFALAGFIAGLGGALLGATYIIIGFGERFFRVEDSWALVSMAVIGGLGSIGGAVLGAFWVIGLPLLFDRNQTVMLFTSSIGLLIILLYLPGGFVQIAYWIRGVLLNWLEARLPERPVKTVTTAPPSLRKVATSDLVLNADASALRAQGLSVHFGGLVAVDGVDFHAKPGEVIGLIGTNGAGKSTLLNAIGGYVPSTGKVELLGKDVTSISAHNRARAGLGRTFQAATLFPELTVRETVQLALEAREPTSFWGSLLWVPSIRPERRKQAEAAELIDFFGLGRYADRFIAELSTGTRRIVELTAVLAVGPRVICLDEPTAGVAQREAEAFGPLIKQVQRELQATLIVVEHDMPLILSISDRVYCLEAGAIIAEGDPDSVRNDPRVVASYLGTDERAIQRSNA